MDVGHWIWLASRGVSGTVNFGGGGIFDTVIVSGLIAVFLAEIIGETRERLQGGPETEGRPKKLLKGLSDIEFTNSLGTQDNNHEKERGNSDEK